MAAKEATKTPTARPQVRPVDRGGKLDSVVVVGVGVVGGVACESNNK